MKIVLFPNPVLRQKSKEITVLDNQTLKEIENLKTLLLAEDKGAGLAAPQLGVSKRMFGLKSWQGDKPRVEVFINPKIVATFGQRTFTKLQTKDGEEDFLEGCLSFPGIFGTVKRWFKIQVYYEVVEGEGLAKREATLEGFGAIVFQHELNHLDGILLPDLIWESGGKFLHQVDGKIVPMPKREIAKLREAK